MSEQSEALRLADTLEKMPLDECDHEAAAELRRLHALNAKLVEALRDVLSTHPHGEALEKKGNRPRRSILAVRAGRAALADSMKDTRICTCHPDDNPPKPCPRKYALSECREAALAEPLAWMHNNIDTITTHRPADLDRHPERWTALYAEPKTCMTCEALARAIRHGTGLLPTGTATSYLQLARAE